MSLRTYFDPLFQSVKFNAARAKAFSRFQTGFVNKNEEHMLFFGGNLLGVQVVRFTLSDYHTFFDEVAGVDAQAAIAAVKADKDIPANFKVASDEFNLVCFYCAYRFLTSPDLDQKAKTEAATNALLIFHYKIITSLMAHYFRYPADPEIAQAAYSALSARFLIKKLGSWQEVFLYRTAEILKSSSIHSKVLKTFDEDLEIIYLVGDSQGRIRDMVKNITDVFMKVHVSGERVDVSTMHEITLDGQETLKDRIHGPSNYEKYLLSVISDPHTFIKEELFSVVLQVMPAVSAKMFRAYLLWLTAQVHGPHHKDLEHFIQNMMVYTIDYLNRNGQLLKQTKDITSVLVDIRNLFLSSRSADEHLKKIRDDGTKLILGFDKTLGETQTAALRTSAILYLCIRAFTKQYYHQ